MKVPLLGFLGKKEEADDMDLLDELIQEQLVEVPLEELTAKSEEEEEPEAEQEERQEESFDEDEGAIKMNESKDDMLKVFLAVEEEFSDTSNLVAEIEDIPAIELLAEAQAIAGAFNIQTQMAGE